MKLAPLFAGQPEAIFLHPLAQCLARDFETMSFGQHLSGQCRTEIRILFLDEAQRIIPFGLMDQVVRRLPTRLMTDRRCAILTIPLQQPEYLPTRQIQHVRRVVDAQPTIINLHQYFHTVQLALVHHHPSHAQSPFAHLN